MILKIKAFIYRHTGIYLACSEELKLLRSDDFMEWVEAKYLEEGNELSIDDLVGLGIGLWHVRHGFTRRFKYK